MTAAMSALYSPRDNPWSSPSSKDHKACLSPLFFSTPKEQGLWNMGHHTNTPTTTQQQLQQQQQESDKSWGTACSVTPLDLSFLETPTQVQVPHEWSDEVSLLNDNPEEDDIEVLYLPKSTYDVLVPLFDELYIDTTASEDAPEEEEEEEDQQTFLS